MRPQATIYGCGMRTPVGLDRAASAAAVRAGISVIEEHPWMVDRFGNLMKVTRDAILDPELDGATRLAALALPAARQALLPVVGMNARVALLVSFGELRPGQDPEMGAQARQSVVDGLSDITSFNSSRHWTGGHAGGLVAMEMALKLLQSGSADFVLAGGVDSYLGADTLEWLDEIEQLHSDDNIYGFCPGEAAGFVLLGAPAAPGAPGLLDVIAAGSSTEDKLIKTDDICLGEGLSRAFAKVGALLPEATAVDRILSDMNGERYRGNEYGFAVLRNTDMFNDAAAFEAPADCWGDVGAATGPLLAGLAIEGHARRYAPGPLSLLWGSSEHGRRAAVIVAERKVA